MLRRRILRTLILACVASAPAFAQTGSVPASFVLSTTPGTIYANAPVTLIALGLPSSATGTVVFTDASTTLATVTINGASVASYQAFGDSITAGSSYAGLVGSAYGLALADYAIDGAIACDKS